MYRIDIFEMLRTIEIETEYTWHLTGKRTLRKKVLKAMAKVPREEFVPPEIRPCAYDNQALPIGEGQTISQPFIVALMTDLLEPEKNHSILEIGTGSGYQAAILSLLVKDVYTVEIVPELAQQSARSLTRLGYNNVKVREGDGYRGWPEHAPFDGIIVTAAVSHVPPLLLEQLKPGGNLVIPIGLPYMHQELTLVKKDLHGNIHSRDILGVIFVPLTGEEGGYRQRKNRNTFGEKRF